MFDEDEDDEGIFKNETNVFDKGASAEAASGELLTREEDREANSPPANIIPFPGQKRERVDLVARYDANGEPFVKRVVIRDGKPVSLDKQFRRPTPDEYQSLLWNGKIVQGGIVAENTNTSPGRGMAKTPLGETGGTNWKKVGLIGAGVVGVGVAGWLGWRWWQGRQEED